MVSYKQKSEKLKSEFIGYDFNMNNLTCAVIALLEEISTKLDRLEENSIKLDKLVNSCNCESKEETVVKKEIASKK